MYSSNQIKADQYYYKPFQNSFSEAAQQNLFKSDKYTISSEKRYMKGDQPNHNQIKQEETVTCPECRVTLPIDQTKVHIQKCQKYVPTFMNNAKRFIDYISPDYAKFMIAEIDMVRQQLMDKIQKEKQQSKTSLNQKQKKDFHKASLNSSAKIQSFSTRNKILDKKENDKIENEEINKKKEKDKKIQNQERRQLQSREKQTFSQVFASFEGTLKLQDEDYFEKQPEISKQVDQNHYNQLESLIKCVVPGCLEKIGINQFEKFTYLDQCLHTICHQCSKGKYLKEEFLKNKGQINCPDPKCNLKIPIFQLEELIGKESFQELEMEINRNTFNLIKCSKCQTQYEFLVGKTKDAPKKTQEGSKVTQAMAIHFAENRFSCQKCKQEQCRECRASPYHLGFNCKEFEEHKLKKKCRYCNAILPLGYLHDSGIKTLDDICEMKECSELAKKACSKKLKCGHSCFGCIKEKECLPCLKEECAKKMQKQLHAENQNSYCSLCYIESLSQSPCIKSKCGHIFHQKCLTKRLELKWATPRILLKFCQCPLCNKWLEVADQFVLSKQLKQYKNLYNIIREKALKRLKYENEDKSEKLTDKNSGYFKNEEKYAMTIYAYFQCYDCKKPYFGGRKSCADAMSDAKEEQKFNPKELICPECCPVEVNNCKKHGKQYISFKCKFCCSVAQWFCWGNTHFCDKCHKSQLEGVYVSKISKDKLPQCEGKGKCPIGGEHGGNGDERSIGCALCRNEQEGNKDF